MMREHFWRKPISEYTQPPLTPEMIKKAEQTLGVKLPASYIELLMVQNGGDIRYDTYRLPHRSKMGAHFVSVSMIMGIGPDRAHTILGTSSHIKEWRLPKQLVLLDGDGHTWIALDYRSSGARGEPSVLWIDNEAGEKIKIASNFAEFVNGLFDGNTRYVFGLGAGTGLDPVPMVTSINQALSINLAEVDYPPSIRQATSAWDLYKDSTGRFWFLPNKNRDDFYEYPWEPDCIWILECKVSREESAQIQAKLEANLSCSVKLLHEPLPEMA